MRIDQLMLPEREEKPRTSGITVLIDNGVPLNFFRDTVISSGKYIDFVKFGWGTSLVTEQLSEKIACLRYHDIEFFFGGTLFEKFASQGKVESFHRYCKKSGCRYVEISNGTIEMTNSEKALYIEQFSRDFSVFSEVGSKSGEISDGQNSSQWIDWICEDLNAGAKKVITETRESGTSGLCRSNGEIRLDIIGDIVASGIDLDSVIFEAPSKRIQTELIKAAGADVNLANISFSDTIPLETLRLGLRSDTFHLFKGDAVNARN
ncbi:phosphosulfolactate synthase [Mesobacillus zeae]|uniref:Phosphosulfolactate synthase n=1 Tax=Mesobacillus zeae TaxID=1917180 RepID=A0A398BIE0_9BACI|nr:phosphosulfolactate synthase [Mesobacillus zeae]RID88811.1 phosphosulfolactate synthase [Mesobacillus zeae]